MYTEAKKELSYIPKKYHKYKKLWSKQFGERLTKHALQDHEIKLEPGTSLKFFSIYKLIEIKKQALKEFVKKKT